MKTCRKSWKKAVTAGLKKGRKAKASPRGRVPADKPGDGATMPQERFLQDLLVRGEAVEAEGPLPLSATHRIRKGVTRRVRAKLT